jgi:hypothetical protein
VLEPPADVHFPTTVEVRAGLALDPAEWQAEVDEEVEREHPSPDGTPAHAKTTSYEFAAAYRVSE